MWWSSTALTKTVSVEQLQERTVGMKLKKEKDFFRGFAIKREKEMSSSKERTGIKREYF